MMGLINENDMKKIEEIANQYNLSVTDFGRKIITQAKKRNERQFRVSEDEFEIISEKAREHGVTVSRYCENACGTFADSENLDYSFFGCKIYGGGRNKRITVSFKNDFVEDKFMEIANKLNIEISSLMRYCALNY